jgi:zinc protease
VRKILITLFTLFACQSFGQVQEYILNNGLKVLVKEDHRAPVAVSMIWYNVGSADEQGGNTGLSHSLEHMMFKGTSKYPTGAFSQLIASQGGQENAFTNNDYTAYFEKIAAKNLATSFELEADRMRNLLLNENEFAKEIKVIQEERRLRTEDNPQALAFERFLATAHLASAYNHPVIGWMSDLQQMDVTSLRRWYQQYYAPNNATLVVVGDVEPQKVHALAEQYFGTITKSPVPPRKPQLEPPSLGKKSLLIHGTAKLPLLLIGYTVPSVTTAKKPWEPYALELIAGILDAGDGARLTKNIIRNKHIAAGAEVYYNLYSRYQTQFLVYGTPSQNYTVQDLQKALFSELDAIKNKPISTQELQRIKNQIIAQKTFEKDSIFGQAMELGLLETIGIGWKSAESYNQEINKVTASQIQQTAKDYFQEDNSTVAELKPLGTNG